MTLVQNEFFLLFRLVLLRRNSKLIQNINVLDNISKKLQLKSQVNQIKISRVIYGGFEYVGIQRVKKFKIFLPL